MNDAPSFHRIDYSIRTNKNIERKIVFDKLGEISKVLPLRDYRYLGFGSMWFVDFVLAHRQLNITKMTSIERKESADRAEFNKPYDCIGIEPGSCSQVLADFEPEMWKTPFAAWLDYDGRFDVDVRGDCEKFLRSAAVGSVFVVTVNANRSSYRSRDPMTSPPAVQKLRELLGDAVPIDAPTGTGKDVGAEEFPTLLSKSILNFMATTVRTSGRETEGYPDRFVPLFDLCHVDNATMATVGGMIVSWKHLHDFVESMKVQAPDLFAGAQVVAETLDLIPITMKEKLTLDRMLPSESQEFLERLANSGVRLAATNAEKYRRLYRHFPVFAETSL